MVQRSIAGLAAAAVLVVGGCGSQKAPAPASGARKVSVERGAVTVTRTDPRGDVNQFQSTTSHPAEARLDLREVVLRRDSRRLRVTFRTVAPPGGPMSENFIVFGPTGLRSSTLVIDWTYKPGPQGELSGPGLTSRELGVRVAGTTVSADLPLNRVTRASVFKWQATTAAGDGGGELADLVPDQFGNYGFFSRSAP